MDQKQKIKGNIRTDTKKRCKKGKKAKNAVHPFKNIECN